MAHHTLIYRGKVEIPKHENKAIRGYVHNRDAAIAIDWTTLQSVYTWTQPGMAPGRCTTDRPILPCELSVVMVPSCIRSSKRSPSEGTTPELWNAPMWPHRSRSERVVSPPPLPHWYPAILLAGMLPVTSSSLLVCKNVGFQKTWFEFECLWKN
jgi:hypothetical protein